MCKAVEDFAKEYAEEVQAIADSEKARADEAEKDTIDSIHNLMKKMNLSADEAMDFLGFSNDKQAKYKSLL